MADWKRAEGDKLWDAHVANEKSGASFESKKREAAKIQEHLSKVGGVRRDPDRGELTTTEMINKKIKFGSQRPTH